MKNLPKLALITTVAFGFFSQANPASADTRITCRSERGRYSFCETNTRGGVRFVRQISNAECRQGDTWGYDRNGIWVDRGCSAEFAVRDRGNNNNYNSGGGDNTAAIIGGALAIGAISAILGNSGNSSNNNNNSFGETITCGSDRGSYNLCRVNLSRRDRVVLKRQLSNSGCWEGDTWGYDQNGIWVDRGCRGLFEVIR